MNQKLIYTKNKPQGARSCSQRILCRCEPCVFFVNFVVKKRFFYNVWLAVWCFVLFHGIPYLQFIPQKYGIVFEMGVELLSFL
jgi:hypothetical protein